MLLAAPILLGAAPAGRLDVAVERLRSTSGQIRICLTRLPANFPDCKGGSQIWTRSAPATGTPTIAFGNLPSGDYALSAFHDENGNAKLDTFARIPREGFGFSRNPAIRFGPPSFRQARFSIASGEIRQTVRMKYFL